MIYLHWAIFDVPDPTNHELLAEVICWSGEIHDFQPKTIFVRTADEAAALAALTKALGFTIRRKKKLDAVRDFKEAMMRRVVGGRR